MLQPEVSAKEQAIMPFLRLAFRPFFLLPALLSIIAVIVWLGVLHGDFHWQGVLAANIWHGHEMIFGFAASVAVGFLLTAAQTWTGVRSLHGWQLALAVIFWLLARLTLSSKVEFIFVIGIITEALWWLICIGYLAYMIVKSNNSRNLIFIPLLSIIMALDLAALLGAYSGNIALASHLLYAAVFMICSVVTVVGGRVIPFFTSRALNLASINAIPYLERIVALSMGLSFISFVMSYFFLIQPLLAILFIITGIMQLLRMANWQTFSTFKTPLLWSLHLSYLNMAIGFTIIGISYFTSHISFSSAIHIITVGTIGTMIIAMMSRVSLGHTGRTLQSNSWVSISFLLLLSATLFRFVMPITGWLMSGYILAAVCWSIGFAIFIFYYLPMLIKARPDGHSG